MLKKIVRQIEIMGHVKAPNKKIENRLLKAGYITDGNGNFYTHAGLVNLIKK